MTSASPPSALPVSVSSTLHMAVRTKPWLGRVGSVGWGPNQGQQTGIPPRMGLPGAKALSRLTKSTGSPSRGW